MSRVQHWIGGDKARDEKGEVLDSGVDLRLVGVREERFDAGKLGQ